MKDDLAEFQTRLNAATIADQQMQYHAEISRLAVRR